MLELGGGAGTSRLVGDGSRRYPPPTAAMVNGTLAHSLDFDDTHGAGSIHCSAPVVPAALAAAEVAGSSGKELVAAITAGFEVMTRLSLALDPRLHYERGYHPTATCGVFGAAAACGNLFKLTEDQMVSAFGIALSQSSGTLQFLVDGSWTKRFQVGYAAHSGLIAATLARENFVGPMYVRISQSHTRMLLQSKTRSTVLFARLCSAVCFCTHNLARVSFIPDCLPVCDNGMK